LLPNLNLATENPPITAFSVNNSHVHHWVFKCPNLEMQIHQQIVEKLLIVYVNKIFLTFLGFSVDHKKNDEDTIILSTIEYPDFYLKYIKSFRCFYAKKNLQHLIEVYEKWITHIYRFENIMKLFFWLNSEEINALQSMVNQVYNAHQAFEQIKDVNNDDDFEHLLALQTLLSNHIFNSITLSAMVKTESFTYIFPSLDQLIPWQLSFLIYGPLWMPLFVPIYRLYQTLPKR
jgi:hypothetical protein